MILETERLILRPWDLSDAESLYEYASDLQVGPIAGWQAHRSIEESRDIIQNVLNGAECYAVCLKRDRKAIGAIELKQNGNGRTSMTGQDDACELGFWLGRPFWGNGYMPEAAKEMIRHGFEDLSMSVIWCGYYDGNDKSRRVQEKCGFIRYCTMEKEVPLMKETRVAHMNILTREQWEKCRT